MRGRLQPLLSTGGSSVSGLSRAGAVGLAALVLNLLAALFVTHSGGRAVIVVIVVVAAAPVAWVIAARPLWLLYAALLLTMIGGSYAEALPGTGGTKIFPADIFAALALAGAVVRFLTRTPGTERAPGLRTVVLTWPFALLAFGLVHGVIRGHDRYGTQYLSQPVRILFYAAIGLTLTYAQAVPLFRNLTRIFYITIVVAFFEALYYLATGTSQTSSESLSTGGTRVLALSTAIYLAAGLVLALINLDLDPRGARRRLHIAMASLAAFGVVVSLGRTTFAAIAVLGPILFVALPRLRRTIVTYAPLLVVLAVLGGTFLWATAPSTARTISDRFTGKLSSDTAVIQRQRKYAAAMQGFGSDPIFGLGFGRTVSFIAVDQSVQTFNGDPENSYIYILAGGGLVALGALLTLVGCFFIEVVARVRRTTGEERALAVFGASLAFILLVNAISGPILSDAPLMLLTWTGLLLPAVAGRRSRTRTSTA